jgi:hypothetical protein
MKKNTTFRPFPFLRKSVLASSCLLLACGSWKAGATNLFWDNKGTSAAASGTWDTTTKNWVTSSTLSTATVVYVNGDFPEFPAGTSTANLTITVNSAVTCAGMWGRTAGTFTFSGTGSIGVTGTALQGFLCTGNLVINVPLTGTGGVEQEQNGYLALYATNTYAGGTEVTGGQFTYYNNSNSFSTGPITVAGNAEAFLNGGTSTITIPNNFIINSGYAINLVGGNAVAGVPGTTFTGTFSLPSSGTVNLESSSTPANVDLISGVISGGANVLISDVGTIEFGGVNTYTGTTTVTNAGTLALTGAGRIGGTGLVTVQTNATFADLNTTGTNTIGGGLTFQAGAGAGRVAAQALFTGAGSSVGSLSVGGNLTLATTPITINVTGSALNVGSYRLLTCSGTVSGAALTNATITGIALPAGYSATVSTTTGSHGHVDLIIDSQPVPGSFALGAVEGVSTSVPTAKVIAVATESPVGGTLAITGVVSPTANGATVTLAGGNITYTSAANLNPDTISYILSDGFNSAVGSIAVTVTANGLSDNALTLTPIGGGQATVTAYGIPGQSYYIQSAPTVTGPWTDEPGSPVAASSLGIISLTVTPTPPDTFYRTSTTP